MQLVMTALDTDLEHDITTIHRSLATSERETRTTVVKNHNGKRSSARFQESQLYARLKKPNWARLAVIVKRRYGMKYGDQEQSAKLS